MQSEGELSEDDLENVAGGVVPGAPSAASAAASAVSATAATSIGGWGQPY